MRLLIGLILISTVPPISGVDVALTGGGGFSGGEETRTAAVSALGASVGAPLSCQFDYLFMQRRHVLTGSYVIRGRTGGATPFFQIGAGIESRYAGLAVLIAAGATIDIGKSLFVRPQVRLYGLTGPTLTFLPAVALGRRF